MTLLASLLLFVAAAPIVPVGAIGDGVPGTSGKNVTDEWAAAITATDACQTIPRALAGGAKVARLRSCRGDVSCLDSAARAMGFDAIASVLVTKASKGLAITAQLLVTTGAPPRFFTGTAMNEAGLPAAYRALARQICPAHLGETTGDAAASLDLGLEDPAFELPPGLPPVGDEAAAATAEEVVPEALPAPVAIGGLTPGPPPRVNPFAPPRSAPAPRGPSRTPVVVAGGVAVLSAALAGFFGYSTLSAARERDTVPGLSQFTQLQGDAEFFSLLTNVAWGVAGASAVAGGVFWATSGPTNDSANP